MHAEVKCDRKQQPPKATENLRNMIVHQNILEFSEKGIRGWNVAVICKQKTRVGESMSLKYSLCSPP